MYEQASKYYDLIHQAHTGDIELFVQMAQTAATSSNPAILDIGCGSGRLVIPIAEAGLSVTGIDNSADMFAVAQKRVAEEEVTAILVEHDVLTWKTEQRFGLIIIGMNTIMEFSNQTVLDLLKAAAKLLAPDGKIVIDVIQPFIMASLDNEEGDLAKDEPLNDGGRKLPLWSGWTAEHEAQQVEIKWRIKDDRVMVDFSNLFYYRYLDQLMDYLPEARLKIEAVWGDYTQKLYDENSERMILVLKA
ncbi:MAG: SAM-dependent methyltransferase [Cellvibrionaceae bacterium]|jgi:SAM-dependent methyltransferase